MTQAILWGIVEFPCDVYLPSWREEAAKEVPVPGVAPLVRARITERFELKVMRWQAGETSISEQPLSVSGHEMRHRSALPYMPV